jgi:hypothetical protein
MATLEQMTKLSDERGFKCRKYQAALAQLEAYAITDMPVYKDADFLRAEILRVVRECREEIEAERIARTA